MKKVFQGVIDLYLKAMHNGGVKGLKGCFGVIYIDLKAMHNSMPVLCGQVWVS